MKQTVFLVAHPVETNDALTIFGCPVVYSGIGKVNAAITATDLCLSGNFNKIINIGSCGSTVHPIGTILKAGKVFQDIDATPLVKEFGATPFDLSDECLISIDKSSDITCLTTDTFFDQTKKGGVAPALWHHFMSADIIDMECFAIARACQLVGVDFECWKWVSDNGLGADWETNKDIGFKTFLENYIHII